MQNLDLPPSSPSGAAAVPSSPVHAYEPSGTNQSAATGFTYAPFWPRLTPGPSAGGADPWQAGLESSSRAFTQPPRNLRRQRIRGLRRRAASNTQARVTLMAACPGRIFLRHGRRMDRAHRIMRVGEPTPSAPRPARTPLRRITAWKPQATRLIMAHTRSALLPDRTPSSLHPLRWMPTIRTIRIMAVHGQAAFQTSPMSPGTPTDSGGVVSAVPLFDQDRTTFGRPQGGGPAGDSYYFLDQWRSPEHADAASQPLPRSERRNDHGQHPDAADLGPPRFHPGGLPTRFSHPRSRR